MPGPEGLLVTLGVGPEKLKESALPPLRIGTRKAFDVCIKRRFFYILGNVVWQAHSIKLVRLVRLLSLHLGNERGSGSVLLLDGTWLRICGCCWRGAIFSLLAAVA
jgi:hypothetical protein